MKNATQYERYQALLEYVDTHFKRQLTTDAIESACFYSYRNINRIFAAMNNQTIGQYLKRLRIEKAAEYLKYSDEPVASIAKAVGFADTASFSKAFKNMVGTAPSTYREKTLLKKQMDSFAVTNEVPGEFMPIEFELVQRTDVEVVFCQYQGSYKNVHEIELFWEELIAFAMQGNLLASDTTYLAEILDDNEITSNLNCRYNAAFTLPPGSSVASVGPFRRKTIPGGDYARFVHQGSHDTSAETYDRIYRQWMQHVSLELDDKETIEIYSDDSTIPESEMMTEIYIPVIVDQQAAR